MPTPMTAKRIRMTLLMVFGCLPRYAQTVLIVMGAVSPGRAARHVDVDDQKGGSTL